MTMLVKFLSNIDMVSYDFYITGSPDVLTCQIEARGSTLQLLQGVSDGVGGGGGGQCGRLPV